MYLFKQNLTVLIILICNAIEQIYIRQISFYQF